MHRKMFPISGKMPATKTISPAQLFSEPLMKATPVLRLFVTSALKCTTQQRNLWDNVVLGDYRWTNIERSIYRIRKAHKNKRLYHFRCTGGRNGNQEDYDTMV